MKQHLLSLLFIALSLICLLSSKHGSAYASSKNMPNILIPKIQSTIKKYPNVICGIYVKTNCRRDNCININGDSSFPAASLIKIPIAIVLLREIDKGKISWNENLTFKKHHLAQGTGVINTKKIETKIKLRQIFKLMLTISDNTATNMIIERLGGVSTTNKMISTLGIKNTKLVNWLGDFKGTNKTCPADLALLLENSLEGDLLSKQSKKIFKNTLLGVKNKSLIKRGIGKHTKFAHKTGTIGISIGDAGIIYLPLGKRITISIMVKRPFNNLNGQAVIREVSRLVYEYLKKSN